MEVDTGLTRSVGLEFDEKFDYLIAPHAWETRGEISVLRYYQQPKRQVAAFFGTLHRASAFGRHAVDYLDGCDRVASYKICSRRGPACCNSTRARIPAADEVASPWPQQKFVPGTMGTFLAQLELEWCRDVVGVVLGVYKYIDVSSNVRIYMV